MAGSKKDYMDLHGHATLQDIIQKYLLDIEDQMIHETLCDTSSKNKQLQANVTQHEIPK